jgi:hypothetical protein
VSVSVTVLGTVFGIGTETITAEAGGRTAEAVGTTICQAVDAHVLGLRVDPARRAMTGIVTGRAIAVAGRKSVHVVAAVLQPPRSRRSVRMIVTNELSLSSRFLSVP